MEIKPIKHSKIPAYAAASLAALMLTACGNPVEVQPASTEALTSDVIETSAAKTEGLETTETTASETIEENSEAEITETYPMDVVTAGVAPNPDSPF